MTDSGRTWFDLSLGGLDRPGWLVLGQTQLKLGKDHDDAVVIAKHGREEAAPEEAAEGDDAAAKPDDGK